jgi:hypothetical protein
MGRQSHNDGQARPLSSVLDHEAVIVVVPFWPCLLQLRCSREIVGS